MKTYVCVCGRTFDNPQKFNGHKQGCSEHIINKYGSVEAFNLIKNRNHNKGEIVHNRYLNKKKEELAKWVLEKHTCEKCGKVMTEYYGTGRFCSQNCANSKSVSVETKQKISTTIRESEIFKKSVLLKRERARSSYYENPHSCCICGTLIPFEHKNNKTCSRECARKLQSNIMIKKIFRWNYTHYSKA